MPTLRERAGSIVRNMALNLKSHRRSTLTSGGEGSPDAVRSPKKLLERLGIKRHKPFGPAIVSTEPSPPSGATDALPLGTPIPPPDGWLCCQCQEENLNKDQLCTNANCGHNTEDCNTCKRG
jgi:hypothetical protein